MSAKTIALGDVLKILDQPETSDKTLFFVNPSETLNTFFTYKGDLLDIDKLKIELDLHPDHKDSIADKFLTMLENNMKREGWFVLNVGKGSTFPLVDFFKKFKFYDKDMLTPSKIHDKKYALQHGLIRPENDVDNFGNKGIMDIKKRFRLCVLGGFKAEELKNFLDTNKEFNFECYDAQ